MSKQRSCRSSVWLCFSQGRHWREVVVCKHQDQSCMVGVGVAIVAFMFFTGKWIFMLLLCVWMVVSAIVEVLLVTRIVLVADLGIQIVNSRRICIFGHEWESERWSKFIPACRRGARWFPEPTIIEKYKGISYEHKMVIMHMQDGNLMIEDIFQYLGSLPLHILVEVMRQFS